MVKRVILALCVMVLLSTCASSSFARLWSDTRIEVYNGYECGYTPSLALLYGVQPVVSNYDPSMGPDARVLHQTAFGWEDYSVAPGFIAGNGSTSIVSSSTPVIYGQDGHFYATSYFSTTAPGLRPIVLGGPTGPEWIYGGSKPAFASADSTGAIYMAVGNMVARFSGAKWSPPFQLSLQVTDLAISAFGDIAVAGTSMFDGSKTVARFDYQTGQWVERMLARSGDAGKVDVEWDKQGNLGVAYTDQTQGSVKFDYLDLATTTWTSEVVNSQQKCGPGAALAFDRFGNPVIVSGNDLYYDPVAVPEPSAILALAGGFVGLVLRRRTRRTTQH